MFAAAALLNVYTANLLLVDVKKLTKGLPLSFESMAKDTYGNTTKEILRWNLLILLFGFVCGNMVAVAPVSAGDLHAHNAMILSLVFNECQLA